MPTNGHTKSWISEEDQGKNERREIHPTNKGKVKIAAVRDRL